MIKVIIVDDEPLAQDVLESHISNLDNLDLVAKCSNALEANQALKDHEVDIMFLDIQMPQITGIDLLKSLSNPPLVIFTTAYSDYALEGFELNAVDYLLKPISMDRLLKAVNKATEKLDYTSSLSQLESSDANSFFFVKADKKLIKVNFNDILYIEGLKDYVILRQDGSRIITLQTMKSLEEKLPKNIFMRIHRSYIININKIKALMGNVVEIIEKGQVKHIPIGKNYKDALLTVINKNRL